MKTETIIFVHGAWHGKWCWDEHFRSIFENEGYRVITFDLPGHDQAGKVSGINKYSIKDYTDALIKQVDQLDHDPILVGHSMGGLIVQKYLEHHTCKRAILLAPAPPHGVLGATLKFATKPYFYPSLLTFNLYGLVNTPQKSSVAFFSASLSEEKIKHYTSKMCSESFKAFLNMLLPRVRIHHHTSIPLLVVAAAEDKIFSIKDNQRTAQRYDADLKIIPDIAHDIMLDIGYAKVAQAMIQWLDK